MGRAKGYLGGWRACLALVMAVAALIGSVVPSPAAPANDVTFTIELSGSATYSLVSRIVDPANPMTVAEFIKYTWDIKDRTTWRRGRNGVETMVKDVTTIGGGGRSDYATRGNAPIEIRCTYTPATVRKFGVHGEAGPYRKRGATGTEVVPLAYKRCDDSSPNKPRPYNPLSDMGIDAHCTHGFSPSAEWDALSGSAVSGFHSKSLTVVARNGYRKVHYGVVRRATPDRALPGCSATITKATRTAEATLRLGSPRDAGWPLPPSSHALPNKFDVERLAGDMSSSYRQIRANLIDAFEGYVAHRRSPARGLYEKSYQLEREVNVRAVLDLFFLDEWIFFDPPDPRYLKSAVPRSWRDAHIPSSVCGHVKHPRACLAVVGALRRYAAEAGRTTSVLEAIGVTANRYGSARKAFNKAARAPRGFALQGALLKVYSGELADALRQQASATGALRRALTDAGWNRLRLSASGRSRAAALLASLTLPGDVLRRLVADGAGNASELQGRFHALATQEKVPATVSLFPVTTAAAPHIPGESLNSMTLADLYWISAALPDTHSRAILLADLQAAHDAKSSSQKRSALNRFLATAKRYEPGQLSILLQTAVRPLL